MPGWAARRALRARAAALPLPPPPRCPGAAPRRPHCERRENFYSGVSQTPSPTPASLTLWSRLKREREGAEEGGKEEGGGEPEFEPVINSFPADSFPGTIRYLPAAGTGTYFGD